MFFICRIPPQPSPPVPLPRREGSFTGRRGFTAVELIIVLLLIVAALGLTLPAILSPLGRTELEDAARQVRTALAQTRSAAIESGMPHEFRFQPGGSHWEIAARLPSASSLSLMGGDLPGARGTSTNDSAKGFGGDVGDAMPTIEEELPHGVIFVLQTSEDTDADAADFETAIEAEVSTSAAEYQSESIIFYPNGRTSDERIRLLGPHHFLLDVLLRGLTGMATIGEPVRSEKALLPTEVAATTEKSLP